jgi:hypothetical protein
LLEVGSTGEGRHESQACLAPHRAQGQARRPIPVPSGIFRNAPNPNAARLFQNFLFSVDA